MTPERWQRVEELFHLSLEREAGQWAAFLAEACAGDSDLRSQVELLLAYDGQQSDILETPASGVIGDWFDEDQPRPMPGRRIGAYQVTREIGHGGMGAVYLALRADGQQGQKRTNQKHILGSDHRNKCEILRQRFEQLGPEAVSFFDELVRVKRCGKEEARRILGLLVTYRRQDLVAALERARSYRAYALSAIERILAAQAQPRTTVEVLQEEAREHLNDLLRESPVPPRSGSDYQNLLENASEPEGPEDEKANEPDESA